MTLGRRMTFHFIEEIRASVAPYSMDILPFGQFFGRISEWFFGLEVSAI